MNLYSDFLPEDLKILLLSITSSYDYRNMTGVVGVSVGLHEKVFSFRFKKLYNKIKLITIREPILEDIFTWKKLYIDLLSSQYVASNIIEYQLGLNIIDAFKVSENHDFEIVEDLDLIHFIENDIMNGTIPEDALFIESISYQSKNILSACILYERYPLFFNKFKYLPFNEDLTFYILYKTAYVSVSFMSVDDLKNYIKMDTIPKFVLSEDNIEDVMDSLSSPYRFVILYLLLRENGFKTNITNESFVTEFNSRRGYIGAASTPIQFGDSYVNSYVINLCRIMDTHLF